MGLFLNAVQSLREDSIPPCVELYQQWKLRAKFQETSIDRMNEHTAHNLINCTHEVKWRLEIKCRNYMGAVIHL